MVVGDTVDIRNVLSGPSFHLEVIAVDSILIDAEYRKRFYLESIGWPYSDVWVEGIGSLLHGVIYCGYYNTSPWFTLLCFKENNEVFYMNPDYPGCYYPPVTIQENENQIEYFTFNSLFNQIIISETSLNMNIKIYDLYGREIISANSNHADEPLVISFKNKASGIYIGIVFDGIKPLFTKKIFIP
ncbi:MAG: hypothetical protein R2750_05820 [Bacteroidales bacterium]